MTDVSDENTDILLRRAEMYYHELQTMVLDMKDGVKAAVEALAAIQYGDQMLHAKVDSNKAEHDDRLDDVVTVVGALQTELVSVLAQLQAAAESQKDLECQVESLQYERDILLEELEQRGAISEQVRIKYHSGLTRPNGLNKSPGGTSLAVLLDRARGVGLNALHHPAQHHTHHSHHSHHTTPHNMSDHDSGVNTCHHGDLSSCGEVTPPGVNPLVHSYIAGLQESIHDPYPGDDPYASDSSLTQAVNKSLEMSLSLGDRCAAVTHLESSGEEDEEEEGGGEPESEERRGAGQAAGAESEPEGDGPGERLSRTRQDQDPEEEEEEEGGDPEGFSRTVEQEVIRTEAKMFENSPRKILPQSLTESVASPFSRPLTPRKVAPHERNAREVQRGRVAREIMDTERKYCTNLWTILDGFREPLAQSAVVSLKEVNAMFPPCLNTMYEYHSNFLAKLEERLSNWKWQTVVGDVIARFIDSSECGMLMQYQNYVNNFPTALMHIKRLCKQSGRFKKLLKTVQRQPVCEGLDVGSFLVTPIQRIPRYVLLLKQLLKFTNTDHPDHYYIENALDKLGDFLNQLNDSIEYSMQVVSAEGTPKARRKLRIGSFRSSFNSYDVGNGSKLNESGMNGTSVEDNSMMSSSIGGKFFNLSFLRDSFRKKTQTSTSAVPALSGQVNSQSGVPLRASHSFCTPGVSTFSVSSRPIRRHDLAGSVATGQQQQADPVPGDPVPFAAPADRSAKKKRRPKRPKSAMDLSLSVVDHDDDDDGGGNHGNRVRAPLEKADTFDGDSGLEVNSERGSSWRMRKCARRDQARPLSALDAASDTSSSAPLGWSVPAASQESLPLHGDSIPAAIGRNVHFHRGQSGDTRTPSQQPEVEQQQCYRKPSEEFLGPISTRDLTPARTLIPTKSMPNVSTGRSDSFTHRHGNPHSIPLVAYHHHPHYDNHRRVARPVTLPGEPAAPLRPLTAPRSLPTTPGHQPDLASSRNSFGIFGDDDDEEEGDLDVNGNGDDVIHAGHGFRIDRLGSSSGGHGGHGESATIPRKGSASPSQFFINLALAQSLSQEGPRAKAVSRSVGQLPRPHSRAEGASASASTSASTSATPSPSSSLAKGQLAGSAPPPPRRPHSALPPRAGPLVARSASAAASAAAAAAAVPAATSGASGGGLYSPRELPVDVGTLEDTTRLPRRPLSYPNGHCAAWTCSSPDLDDADPLNTALVAMEELPEEGDPDSPGGGGCPGDEGQPRRHSTPSAKDFLRGGRDGKKKKDKRSRKLPGLPGQDPGNVSMAMGSGEKKKASIKDSLKSLFSRKRKHDKPSPRPGGAPYGATPFTPEVDDLGTEAGCKSATDGGGPLKATHVANLNDLPFTPHPHTATASRVAMETSRQQLTPRPATAGAVRREQAVAPSSESHPRPVSREQGPPAEDSLVLEPAQPEFEDSYEDENGDPCSAV